MRVNYARAARSDLHDNDCSTKDILKREVALSELEIFFTARTTKEPTCVAAAVNLPVRITWTATAG